MTKGSVFILHKINLQHLTRWLLSADSAVRDLLIGPCWDKPTRQAGLLVKQKKTVNILSTRVYQLELEDGETELLTLHILLTTEFLHYVP